MAGPARTVVKIRKTFTPYDTAYSLKVSRMRSEDRKRPRQTSNSKDAPFHNAMAIPFHKRQAADPTPENYVRRRSVG